MPEALGQVAHSSQSTLNATNAAEASPQVSFSDVTETPRRTPSDGLQEAPEPSEDTLQALTATPQADSPRPSQWRARQTPVPTGPQATTQLVPVPSRLPPAAPRC